MSDDDRPPPPAWTKPPDHAERRNLAKLPTGEWNLSDVVHELKQRRRTRWTKLSLQIIGALTPLALGAFGVWKAYAAHGTADGAKATSDASAVLTEYRLSKEEEARKALELEHAADVTRLEHEHYEDAEKVREKLERLQVKQASCCARKDHD